MVSAWAYDDGGSHKTALRRIHNVAEAGAKFDAQTRLAGQLGGTDITE